MPASFFLSISTTRFFSVMIDELRGIKVASFTLEDVFGELPHVRRDLYGRNVVEVLLRDL